MTFDATHTRESDEKLVYEILCDTTEPPEGRHWEGWMAEKIVSALSTPIPLTPSDEMVGAAADVIWSYDLAHGNCSSSTSVGAYRNVARAALTAALGCKKAALNPIGGK